LPSAEANLAELLGVRVDPAAVDTEHSRECRGVDEPRRRCSRPFARQSRSRACARRLLLAHTKQLYDAFGDSLDVFLVEGHRA
jgi:hypothetical protein